MDKKTDKSGIKENRFVGWFSLLFGVLLLIDGIIKVIFNITWIGWSYKSQHETYNNGWYLLLIGSMLSIGAFLRLRSSYKKKDR